MPNLMPGEEREWTINVCPNCDKLLSTWPPENECKCEPVAIGHGFTHLEVPVAEASRLADTERERDEARQLLAADQALDAANDEGDLTQALARALKAEAEAAEARKHIEDARYLLSHKESVRGRTLRDANWSLHQALAALSNPPTGERCSCRGIGTAPGLKNVLDPDCPIHGSVHGHTERVETD